MSQRREISMSSPDLTEEDAHSVVEVVRSGRLALGPKAAEFERELARLALVRHGVAVSSGTAALHLLVRAMGIGSGDEVLVPSFTFAASVNVLFYEGATPVFVDIQSDTYNLSPADLERKVTERTKAIMVVDVFGHPAEWDDILRIANAHGLKVIDDSCEAIGAEYRGRPLGSFGDAGAFAFYPNKQITTGEGGAIVTDDESIATMCRTLRNQGRGDMGAWVDHERLGYNYRLDEMSAALGVSQLARLDEILAKRERVARMYTERLDEIPWLTTPATRPYVRRSWFVYVVHLAEGLDRDRVMAAVEAEGVPVRGYFRPLHTMPYIREKLGSDLHLPVTESTGSRTIALPFHGNLVEEEVDYVVAVLRKVVGRLW